LRDSFFNQEDIPVGQLPGGTPTRCLMTTRAMCRDRAAECCHNAELAMDPSDKEAWLQLAQNWLTLSLDTTDEILHRLSLQVIDGGKNGTRQGS